MKVIQEEIKWGRQAILEIFDDTVLFDTSDEEYGPYEFPLSKLEEAIAQYKKERDGGS